MAKKKWLEILNWSEKNINDLRIVAYSYIKEGKYDIALKFLNALKILSPNNVYEKQTIGAIYLQQGKSLDALTNFDEALKADPYHYPTLLNRAKALFSLGYKIQAKAQTYSLVHCKDKSIAKDAKALLTAFE